MMYCGICGQECEPVRDDAESPWVSDCCGAEIYHDEDLALIMDDWEIDDWQESRMIDRRIESELERKAGIEL